MLNIDRAVRALREDASRAHQAIRIGTQHAPTGNKLDSGPHEYFMGKSDAIIGDAADGTWRTRAEWLRRGLWA